MKKGCPDSRTRLKSSKLETVSSSRRKLTKTAVKIKKATNIADIANAGLNARHIKIPTIIKLARLTMIKEY